MVSFIITLLIVFYRIPLINLLGDKGMGYYSIALVVYLLLMTCITYGLPKTVSTLITTQLSKGQYQLVYKTALSSIIFSILAGGILSILLFCGADIIATYIFYAEYSAYAIRALSPCLIFVSILGAFHGIYTATKVEIISKVAYKIEEFFVSVLSIAGVLIFANKGKEIASLKGDISYESAYSSMGAALGLTCGVFIAVIFSAIFFIKHEKKLKRLSEKDKSICKTRKTELIKQILVSMIPFVLTLIIFHVSSLVDYAIFNRIMNVQGHKENSYMILLGMLNGKYEFFISIPLLVVNWFALSKASIFTKTIQTGNNKKINLKISQYTRYTMLCIIPCTAFMIVFSSPLMNLIFSGINDTPAFILKIGAVSIVFYSLAAISNAILNALSDWASVAKNALYAFVVQSISLLIMMIIFQWSIIAVVTSRIVFSAALFILNEHTLRERTGYVQEHKRTFNIPGIAALIMICLSLVIFMIFEMLFRETLAIIITCILATPIYIMALIFLGGITQREMYRIPGGKYLAPLCKKLHLVK